MFDARRSTFDVRILLFPLLLLLSGCFSRETTLRIHPDGTGLLTVRTTLTPEFVSYLEGLTKSNRPEKGFTETRLTAAAARYGKGVTYRDHRTGRKDGRLLLEAVYHVADVDRLRLSLDTTLPLVGDRLARTKPSAFPAYTFHDRGGGRLTLYPPRTRSEPDSLRVKVESKQVGAEKRKRFERERAQWMRFGNPFDLNGEETPAELARRLGRDMRFRLEVVTLHPVAQTTSPYKVDENRILLYAIEVSELLRDPVVIRRAEQGTLSNLSWTEIADSKQVTVDTARFRLLEQAVEK